MNFKLAQPASTIKVEWGLEDPLIADYNEAVRTILEGAKTSNEVTVTCLNGNFEAIRARLEGGWIDPADIHRDKSTVTFTIKRKWNSD